MAAVFLRENIRRAADLGCGAGDWVRALRRRGIDVDGFDGNPETAELTGGACSVANLASEVEFAADYDAVYSFEVAEHIPPAQESVFVANVIRTRPKLVLISWSGIAGDPDVSQPMRAMASRVNPREPEYVREIFAARGYLADEGLRAELAASTPRASAWYECKTRQAWVPICGCCCWWIPPNLHVFRRVS